MFRSLRTDRDRLWHLFLHFKLYPRFRQTSTIEGVPLITAFDRLERDTAALARSMGRIIGASWSQRHQIHQRPRDVDAAFGPDILGSLDTMPVYINRPACPILRRATYSGKYKECVLKVQLACTFTGIPVFMSGPHLGASADITILRQNFPYAIGARLPQSCGWLSFVGPRASGDRWLADKAYRSVDVDDMITPFKKPKGGELTDGQEAFNKVHSWYRATIEHVNAQMKKFSILGGTYRGRLGTADQPRGFEHLHNVLLIITCIVVEQTRRSPLKTNLSLLRLPPRPLRLGLPLGLPEDLRFVHGELRGPGREPSQAAVDTGCRCEDLRLGQAVLVWWWGLWWHAKIHYIRRRDQRVTIRWTRDNSVSPDYPVRLVRVLE